MPIGKKASDPSTPYYVYEFWWNSKVFYVGHTYHRRRSHGRWDHVKNLLRLESEGIISPSKLADLNLPNNRVIAALIGIGLPEHKVTECRWCKGKEQADIEETEQILFRLSQGCILANIEKNPNRVTHEQFQQRADSAL